ncbi:putative entry exclusion protein TrbK-alt [Sphingobium sp. HBC34]|uniref:Entry exclusion protein TrbK-alt n=1 Tax=Sphingobium cyanobacteriorum TaxID=3063954 RepID=A0ABT8ZRS7_9SPHN|nr:putative entry exclusion protein TrbK-alt [Sphingobium sp. HBC34]MDO7837230.1 putative entry exclusion protein TrbK-alt [Sphingobium sp. HBC34]
MDTKLFARIGAVAFVAVAITMTALQLREEPVRAVPEVVDVTDPDSDPLADQLRQCNAMGEAAARDPDCHAAWAEKQRRFLGKTRQAEPAPQTSGENSVLPRAAATDAAPQGEQ